VYLPDAYEHVRVLRRFERPVAQRDNARALRDGPMLGPVVVLLKRQLFFRQHDDFLDDVFKAGVQDLPRAPRALVLVAFFIVYSHAFSFTCWS